MHLDHHNLTTYTLIYSTILDYSIMLQQSQNKIARTTVGALFSVLQDSLQETLEIFDFTLDEGLIWLNHFNWNVEKFCEFYTSSNDQTLNTLRREIGLTFDQPETTTKVNICTICCTSPDYVQLRCGHSICGECFTDYVDVKLAENPFIRCFQDKCGKVIRYSTLQKHYLEFTRYQLELGKHYMKLNKNVRPCPNKNCDIVIENLHQLSISVIECPGCKKYFCLSCKEGDHRPSNCREVAEWRKVNLSQDKETLAIIQQCTKFCPNCRQPIEKNQGCNHMTCKPPQGCGHEFCWPCLGKWSDHSEQGGYYTCNNYKDLDEEKKDKLKSNLDKTKSSLEKLIFYSTRFTNHEKAENIAHSKMPKIQRKVNLLAKNFGMSVDELEFIHKTYQFLLQARQTLKWTYCYGYFLRSQKSANFALFEFNQADFERACENLHFLLENDLSAMVRGKQFTRQGFLQLKQQIINSHQATDRFMKRFLEGLSDKQM